MKKQFFMQVLLLLAFFSSTLFSTTYENGTNNTGWHLESTTEDDNLVTTSIDNEEGNIISLEANSTGLFLGGYRWDSNLRWDNSQEKIFNIRFKTIDKFEIVLLVVNSNGENRYLHYWESIDIEDTQKHKYISLNQNTRDGNWHTIKRDLEADLGEAVSKVEGILVRRSNMDIKFVKLTNNTTTYENGTNSTGWHLESTTQDGNLVTTSTDNEEGNIVSLEANSTELFLGGYRWDSNLRWDNSQEKIFNIRLKTTDNFNIILFVVNSNGENRYLHYWESIDIEDTQKHKYISLNQDTKDGNWHTIKRDLEADLGEAISKVEGILVRRSNIDVKFVKLTTPLEDFGTLSEDAEDENIDGWSVYDNIPEGATITNVYDSDKRSRVIEFQGDGTQNMYRFVGTWNNHNDKIIKWSMKYDEYFYVYVQIQTVKGNRILAYSPHDSGRGIRTGSQQILHGLGVTSNDGKWHTFARNLEADLKRYESDNELLYTKSFFIRGSGRVDDIGLYSSVNSIKVDSANHGVTPGVAFTFDDSSSINSWGLAQNIFQDNNITATFFIDRWHLLTPEKFNILQTLRSDGHQIACHTYEHVSVFDSRYDNEDDKVQAYLEDQVLPAINNMEQDGFHPVSFAYPYTKYTGRHNAKIKKYFPSGVRCFLSNTMSIDNISGNTLDDIKAKMAEIKANKEVVTFIAHIIVPEGEPQIYGYSIKEEKLKAIIDEANRLGLKFYSFDKAYNLSKLR